MNQHDVVEWWVDCKVCYQHDASIPTWIVPPHLGFIMHGHGVVDHIEIGQHHAA